MRIAIVLAGLVAASANAQDFAQGLSEASGLVAQIRASGIAMRPIIGAREIVPSQGAPAQLALPQGDKDGGPGGRRRAVPGTPINTGFKALGAAGQTGRVNGPGRQGNGDYKIIKNDPSELILEVLTGYIRGQFTLTRDAQGHDSMRFTGQLWEGGRWAAPKDETTPVSVTYDARSDSGRIKWKEDGDTKEEGYWGGKEGNRRMVIEFGGGWDHDFSQR